MAKLVITIDGPAGSGKSTIAMLLAERIGASFLDTGAMYRAVTVAAIEAGVDMEDEAELCRVLEESEFEFTAHSGRMQVFVNGADVTAKIREPEVTAKVKYVAVAGCLRERLVVMQREFAAGEEMIVTEGRDQGTVAFGDASFKFFLTANVSERARRRQAELEAKGQKAVLSEVQEAIEKRDASDQEREVGPLRAAEDAIIVDTTDLDIEGVLGKLLGFIE